MVAITVLLPLDTVRSEVPRPPEIVRVSPAQSTALTEPPCSYCSNLFDGKKYQSPPLPPELNVEASQSMGDVDRRLPPLANVLGVEFGTSEKAYPVDDLGARSGNLLEGLHDSADARGGAQPGNNGSLVGQSASADWGEFVECNGHPGSAADFC